MTAISAVGGFGNILVAPTRDGDRVWIGMQSRLFEVNARSRNVLSSIEPSLKALPAAEVNVPAGFRRFHNISALAIDSDGDLAVAEDGTAEIALITQGGKVSKVALPAATAATNLTFSSTGELAVGLVSFPARAADKVLLIDAKGHRVVANVASQYVVPRGNGFASGDSSFSSTTFIAADANMKAATTSGGIVTSGPYRSLVGSAPIFLNNGDEAYATASGVAIARSAAASIDEYVLPSYDCSSMAIPSTGDSSRSPTMSSTCAAYPLNLTVDESGDIWYLSSSPDQTIGEIAGA